MAKRTMSMADLAPQRPVEPAPAAETPKSTKPAYRENKRAFTAWASKDAYRQLKSLANDRDTTVQALLEEGMDLVFERYGYSQIARSQGSNTANSQ